MSISRSSPAPRASVRRLTPALDLMLQAIFDPEELAVHVHSFIAPQIDNQSGSFVWGLPAGFLDPASPLEKWIGDRPQPLGFCHDVCPHVRFHVAWMDDIR